MQYLEGYNGLMDNTMAIEHHLPTRAAVGRAYSTLIDQRVQDQRVQEFEEKMMCKNQSLSRSSMNFESKCDS